MRQHNKIIFAAAVLMAASPGIVRADTPLLTIEADKSVAKVSPMLYGLMTEEINYSYDGGLYAELVRNRAFLDDAEKPAHWSTVANAAIALDSKQPLNDVIPVSLRVEATAATPAAPAGVANSGYWGIPVKPVTRYRASFHAKAASGFSGSVIVSIASDDGMAVYAKARVPGLSADWKRYEVSLETDANVTPTTKARLVLSVDQPGTIWLGLVSLFPPTWNDQPNGFRKDLMQMLVDLKPKFLRFPGGNYLEGDTIATRFDWKKTLGPIDRRPGHRGCWNYRSSDGVGLLEFLLWCEDMGAEPVLAVYAGYSLKGEFVKPGPDLEPYIQDALDEIEYVSGAASTKWGGQRAKDGHPEPFKLQHVEIGNEDFFDKSGSYDGRFAQFRDAIKKKYPQLKCISTVGNEQPAAKRVHSTKPDVLDEHYYRTADSFLKDAPTRFEKYDRNGPEIFVGEWAAHETTFPPWDKRSKGEPPTPNLKAALGDAAWMAAMERNSDIVKMQCYAPLLVNINERQWRPDLIGYDALRSFGSPSYYAFQMFSRNVGDEILKATLTDSPLHHSVTKDTATGTIIIKLVNGDTATHPLRVNLSSAKNISSEATKTVLAGDSKATNSIDNPVRIVPETSGLKVGSMFDYDAPPCSVSVIRITTR